MIWFSCKQCGKTHGRPDDLAGTLVFCECGQGNRVPWTSTASEPTAAPPAGAEAVPRPERYPDEIPSRPDSGRRTPAAIAIDRNYCLNHEDRPRAVTCDACGEAFCSSCVVTLEGRTLCGPCKDFRARAVRRPPRISWLAVISCMPLAVFGLPVSCCLPMGAANAQADGTMVTPVTVILGLFAMGMPSAALTLGLLGLREIETNPNVGGRWLALTGTITGGLGVLWCLAVYTAVLIKHGSG